MKLSLLRGANARAYIQYLKDAHIPFKMICSNYTIEVQADGLEKKFVANMQSKRTFAAFSKLKSNVSKKPVPDITRDELHYFLHNFKENLYVGDVVNIDLKSAYATILYKDGYIAEDTFKYVCAGTKQERLASVGMLASRKKHFDFDHTGCVRENGYDEVVSPTSNFFFHAVKRTFDIMTTLKALAGEDYLFTWVDGIYIWPNEQTVMRCVEYLNSTGFGHKVERLRDFEVSVNDKRAKIYFLKQDSKGTWSPKPFTLPSINTEFKKIVVEAILTMAATPTKQFLKTKQL